ncbi:hypothetical protein HZS61_008594 [Fusarium oxysporum f. sp. conglutinans]|uniref:Uncharacterized protein n=2 Tax=Fusarium oxysporum f. sp. conglutinans TaxID=100902 RepID=A0A8H6H317_FUSOX|nr:hypothetical protein HZS61_008594 [Fusarium oxysporum f. sp. conglutinans]
MSDLDDWGFGQVKKSKKNPRNGVGIHTPYVTPLYLAKQVDWDPKETAEKASYDDEDRFCEPEAATEYDPSARDMEPSLACDIPTLDAKEEPMSEKFGEYEAATITAEEEEELAALTFKKAKRGKLVRNDRVRFTLLTQKAENAAQAQAAKDDEDAAVEAIPEKPDWGYTRDYVALANPPADETLKEDKSWPEEENAAAEAEPIEDAKPVDEVFDDAVELTEILNVKEYGEIIIQIQLDIGKTMKSLSRDEEEAQSQEEKKLQWIAEERRKLDEREAEVRKGKEKIDPRRASLQQRLPSSSRSRNVENAALWTRQRKAAGECEGEGATTLNVERQDAANVVWAARAAEVGRTGSRGAQSPDCRRLAKPECRGDRSSVLQLMTQYGAGTVHQSILRLLSDEVYESNLIASQRFPDLFEHSVAQSEARTLVEEQATKTEQPALEDILQTHGDDSQGNSEWTEATTVLNGK